MQIGRKAGKQGRPSQVNSSSESSAVSSEESGESSEDEEIASDGGPDIASEGEAVERSASPSNGLIAALEVLTLSSLRMQQTHQLPFLVRNLRRGFMDRCLLLGIPTKPVVHSAKILDIQLIFRLQSSGAVVGDAEAYSDEYKTRMTSWHCPLCDLHGRFTTPVMLQKHVEWDHSEIKTRWTYDNGVSIHLSMKSRLLFH
jgi:hypothetical protein